jgi:hypothetical protein
MDGKLALPNPADLELGWLVGLVRPASESVGVSESDSATYPPPCPPA